MKYSLVLMATVGVGLLLRFPVSTGAANNPAVLLKTLTQAEAHAKFPLHVQKQFRVTAPVKTRYSALKTVANDGRLYIVYASTFPSIWDEEGINTTCKLACQRETAKHVLSKSPKLQRALEKFKFGKQVFGEHPSLALLRIARLSFPKFTRFDLKIDKANTAVTIAIVPLVDLEVKSVKLASSSYVLDHYLKRLKNAAAHFVASASNYSFALDLLEEAFSKGDRSGDVYLGLHQCHVAHGSSGLASDTLDIVEAHFINLLSASQCDELARHCASYCDDPSALRWEGYAQEKRFRLPPLNRQHTPKNQRTK